MDSAWSRTYGRLTGQQQAAVKRAVKGMNVVELGSRAGEHARLLVELGALHVDAIEKDPWGREAAGPRITVHECYFEQVQFSQLRQPADVAFVSWLDTCEGKITGAVRLLQNMPMVVWLGQNYNGTACGSPSVHRHLLGRRVVEVWPHRQNTLIVYAEPLPSGQRRDPCCLEERGWFSPDGAWWGDGEEGF
jgi:hypothetical protein